MGTIMDVCNQDPTVTEEAKALMKYLISSGTIQDMSIRDEEIRKIVQEKRKKTFHDTLQLLRSYRDIAWQLNIAPFEIAEDLGYSCDNINEVIKAFDLEYITENRSFAYRVENIKQSAKLFEALNEAITLLKKKPNNGNRLYNIIYLTYIDEAHLSIDAIAEKLRIARSVYYKMRKEAIAIISTRLWYSMPSKQVASIIEAMDTAKSA